MSTVVVVRKAGYACIGSDSLTMFGSTREPAMYLADPSKMVKHGNAYIATVGDASWRLIWEDYLAGKGKGSPFKNAAGIFRFMRNMHRRLKGDYFLNPTDDKDDPFESSQFHALVASPHGIFGIYALRSVEEYTRFYSFGSGCRFAIGAMYALYDRLKAAEDIALAGLEAAAEFDDSTGAPFERFTVKLKGPRRKRSRRVASGSSDKATRRGKGPSGGRR